MLKICSSEVLICMYDKPSQSYLGVCNNISVYNTYIYIKIKNVSTTLISFYPLHTVAMQMYNGILAKNFKNNSVADIHMKPKFAFKKSH